uniref:TT viral ORF2 n=1 Tax=Anelloviridae sp. cte1V1 TaxID=2828021 RepID=A0A8S5RXC2_9VIRU|nr:MAG TPA: TT viral ORF2 [Anelloviridae sp. cte1V1]
MNAWEYAEELFDAYVWKRVPRTHIFDRPTYPWCPQDTKYTVNFDLNAPQ